VDDAWYADYAQASEIDAAAAEKKYTLPVSKATLRKQ